MSTFGQWLASRAKNTSPSRLIWVCGEERVLVNEVIDATVSAIGVADMSQWRAGKDSEREIWASVLAIPANGYKRLTVIRDAGCLKKWDQLRSWLEVRALMRDSYVLFVDGEHDFPRDSHGKLTSPADMLRDVSCGQIIRCSSLSPEDAIEWVIRQSSVISAWQARHLLSRASGDLWEVRAVLAKVGLFGGCVSDEVLDLLCAELPGDFADRLIRKDLPGSMLAAEVLDMASLGHTLGYLESRLNLLLVLHRASMDDVSCWEVAAKLGVPAFLAYKYFWVATAEYGESRVRKAWLALSAAEDSYRSGIITGVAEVLIVSWWS